jgi:predicted NUDIX family NTP pyrophosphohydrolase
MRKPSAGLLAFRRTAGEPEFLLVHPGGPFWANRDDASWSIPKGEYEPDEEPLDAACREFQEETGFEAAGPFIPLTTLTQPNGKRVSAWAIEADFDASAMTSNSFTMEWPPRSGTQAEFPEVDRAAWFATAEAKRKLLPGQVGFIDELVGLLG